MRESIICFLDKAQKEKVGENILYCGRVIGEAKRDPITGKINSIRI